MPYPTWHGQQSNSIRKQTGRFSGKSRNEIAIIEIAPFAKDRPKIEIVFLPHLFKESIAIDSRADLQRWFEDTKIARRSWNTEWRSRAISQRSNDRHHPQAKIFTPPKVDTLRLGSKIQYLKYQVRHRSNIPRIQSPKGPLYQISQRSYISQIRYSPTKPQ